LQWFCSAYHLKCIDPWLTKNRRNCPICKGKVVVAGMSASESESDVEQQNTNERTPLISGNSFTYGLGPFSRRPNRIIGQPIPANWGTRNESSETDGTSQETVQADDPTPSGSAVDSSEPSPPPGTGRSRSSRSKKNKRTRVMNIRAEITPNSNNNEEGASDSILYESLGEAAALDPAIPVVMIESSDSSSNLSRPVFTAAASANKKQRRSDGIV
jgi:hypothetical protein